MDRVLLDDWKEGVWARLCNLLEGRDSVSWDRVAVSPVLRRVSDIEEVLSK